MWSAEKLKIAKYSKGIRFPGGEKDGIKTQRAGAFLFRVSWQFPDDKLNLRFALLFPQGSKNIYIFLLFTYKIIWFDAQETVCIPVEKALTMKSYTITSNTHNRYHVLHGKDKEFN